MAGLELATAYVSLSVSAKGLAKGVRSEFRQVEREADTSGRAAGEAISRGVKRGTSGVGDAIGDEVAKGGANAETEGRKAGERFGTKMTDGLKATAKVAGGAAALVGGVFTKSLSDALDARQGTAKLTAQLGLTERQSATAGRAAGKLFSGNYGDAVDISGALKSVMQNIDGMKGASEKSLTSISGKVLTVSKAFDQDLGGTTRAVSQMMRTGLAKNADEALDIITVGFQKGADKSEDFLDTLNEYGTQFRKVGIDGRTATGLIQQGLQAGARDGDLVADSIKEFSIRAIDGSKSTVAAYKDLGLNADAMTKKIAAGGPAAKQGLGEVLTRLRGIKDPAQQAAIATSLFGTQAEDMGKALFALDPSKAAKGLGDVAGATDKANKAMNSTPQAKLQNFIRSVQGGLVEAISTKAIPAMERFKAEFDKGEGAGGQFRDALENVKSAIEAVVNFVKANPDLTKGLIGGLAGLYAAKKAVDGVSSAFRGVKSGVDTAKAGWDAGKTAISGLKSAASSTSTALSGLKAGLSGAKPPNATAWTAAGNSIRNAGAAAKGYAASAMSASRAALASAASSARAGAAAALAAAKQGILTAATKAMTVAQRAMNLVMRMNPIGILITALIALGVGLVTAYKKSETFRNIVDGAMRKVRAVFDFVIGWIKNTALPWFSGAMSKMHAVVTFAKDKINVAIGRVRAIFQGVVDWVKGAFTRSWNGLKKIFTNPVDAAKTAISRILGATGLQKVFSGARDAIGRIWDGLKSKLATPLNATIGLINDPFVKGFNNLLSKVPGLSWRIPTIPKIAMATGGVLPGYTPGRDVHRFVSPTGGLLDLSGGEAIMRPEVTRVFGTGLVNRLNAAARSGGVSGVARLMAGDPHEFSTGGVLPHRAFARGGIWDKVKGGISDGYNKVKDVASSALDFVNPASWMKSAANALMGGFGNGFAAQIAKGALSKVVGGAIDAIKSLFSGGGGSGGGPVGGGGPGQPGAGWRWQWATVKKAWPSATLNSAYRPGARTAGYGSLSYHGLGRAIDIGGPQMSQIANWLVANYGAKSHDIIYSPNWGSRAIVGGRWAGVNAVTQRNHYDHVHWGFNKGGIVPEIPTFDNGGTLAPGINVVHNKLGKPEALVRPEQAFNKAEMADALVEGFTRAFSPVTDDALFERNRRVQARVTAQGGRSVLS